jgi:hypothetical protein
MSARLIHTVIGVTAKELRRDLRKGATWADAHLTGNRGKGRAEVVVDSSLGFDELRHPTRGDSPLPATTIVVEVA